MELKSKDIHYVYGLIDPRDGLIRYIGRSIFPGRRLYQHITNYTIVFSLRDAWMQELRSLNMLPEMILIEACNKYSIKTREEYWINHFGLYPNGQLVNMIKYSKKNARAIIEKFISTGF